MLGVEDALTKTWQLKDLDFISYQLPSGGPQIKLHMASEKSKGIVLKRTKTGCFTCRKRRKKCDEARPKCGGCSRNNLRCSWPSGKETCSGTAKGVRGVGTAQSDHIVSTMAGSKVIENGQLSTNGPLFRCGRDMCGLGDLSGLSDISSASRRTPLSPLVLQSYLENTSLLMVAKPAHLNAFLSMVLPAAYFDDLLMDALLAMSGQHLYGIDASRSDIGRTSYRHYGVALRGLHHRIRGAKNMPAAAILDLILVLLLLCHAEAFSGDQNGTMFHHLRACRELILHLLERPGETGRAETRRLMGFALESYSFLALTANVTPYGLLDSRSLPINDPFLTSAKQLESYETFGSFFPCGHTIYAYIPSIAMLGNQRLQEQELNSDYCSFESTKTYEDLLASVSDWQPPNIGDEMKQWSAEYISTGEIWRHAMFIYLKASMCGSTVDDSAIREEIRQHIDTVLRCLREIGSSPFGTIMMWPGLITGSCLTILGQRRTMLNRMRSSRFPNLHLVQASNLLELMWADTDNRAFGPYGLYLTMKKHNINLSIA